MKQVIGGDQEISQNEPQNGGSTPTLDSFESKSDVMLLTKEQLFENLVWLNSQDAANYLRKTVGALRAAVCRGQLRAYKWQRRLYFKRSELDRLLEGSLMRGARYGRHQL